MMTDDLPPQGPSAGPSGQRPEQLQRLLSLDMTRRPSTVKHTLNKRGRHSLKGPLRTVRLCLLSILLPAALVAGPLYLRYHVYGESLYPAAASDMRLLDSRVSTTWCQRQLVKVNTTFNAFLLPEQPQVEPQPVRLSMTRDVSLDDDMKEYWAFYLLQNSTITVSTCVRYPGASLIVIRGHKHLHECAYIGDNSSEEDDEMRGGDIKQDDISPSGQWPLPSGTASPEDVMRNDDEDDDEVNAPDRMRRVRPGVVFHATHTPLESHELLEGHPHHGDEDLTHVVANLIGRVPKSKSSALSSERPSTPGEEEMSGDASVNGGFNRLRQHQKSSTESLDSRMNLSSAEEEVTTPFPHSSKGDNSNLSPPTASSSEVFEEVLKKLQKLGPRGEKVLRRLNKQIGAANSNDEAVRERQEHLRKLFKEMLDQYDKDTRVNRTSREKMFSQDQGADQVKAEGSSGLDALRRGRRQITLGSQLAETLNKHDEDADQGIEEVDLQADGIADHHAILNQTDPLDRSHSEFWSSFSSSEEALLQCAGLVLNLPLTPHRACQKHHSDSVLKAAGHHNTLTYRIPANGYYFFVFNSENEVQTNFLRAHFELEKRVYNVSHPLDQCLNSTESCSLPLGFFSSQKVVLEVPAPLKPNDSSWSQEYVVRSTCEPRTALYLVCVISVPLLILIFAFQ